MLPRVEVCDGLEGVWAPQQFVQQRYNVPELRPLGAVLEPALQHELVHGRGAVHRSGQTEGLVYGLHDL